MSINAIKLQSLLCELKELLRDEEIQNIVVFRYCEDGAYIQTTGHYYCSANGVTFIEIEEEL
jgi:hypothetical protein